MNLDPGIRPLVELLNNNGFVTLGSCQGGVGHPQVSEHRSPNPGRAFVTIKGDPQDRIPEIDALLKKHGYTDYRIARIHHTHYPHGFWLVRFNKDLKETL